MSQRKAMIAAVVEAPGIDMHGIASILGISGRNEVKSLATQLSRLCQIKKLRKDSVLMGNVSRPRYWPTDTSSRDMRSDPNRAHRRSAAAKVGAANRAAGTKPETRATLRAQIRADCKPAAKPAKRDRIIQQPRMTIKRPVAGAQTVEEFQARGGRVQVLAPHEASNPLRFDHSQAQVPMASRRPSTRCRPAPGR